jgi:hypothetical protein
MAPEEALTRAMSTEDAEIAAGMEFEQAQEAIRSLHVSDIDAETQDAQLNPTLQKLAKLFIKLFKEIATRKLSASTL